jgi:hypothetical protein
MKYFKGSLIVTIIALLIAYYLGGIYALYITALLAILEISLSFDNAVVNAKILETMEPKWQQRFITFGMPIAVFGMRFFFPLLVVALASNLGIFETFTLAIENPHKYHEVLVSIEKVIYAFGSAFLFMVFLDFIFDEERDDKWIKLLEENKMINTLGSVNNFSIMLMLIIGLTLASMTSDLRITMAFTFGILLHSFIASLDDFFNMNGVRNGVMGLLYLEVLDASFSFDGVIGAFALNNNIFIIMLGLGVGAMFVRSLTIYFVEKKTLTEYIYLEHGANYAILALSLIMMIKIFYPVNEILIGTIGITFIAISVVHSILEKRSEAKLQPVKVEK